MTSKTRYSSAVLTVWLVFAGVVVDVAVGDGESTAAEDIQQVFLREPNDQVKAHLHGRQLAAEKRSLLRLALAPLATR